MKHLQISLWFAGAAVESSAQFTILRSFVSVYVQALRTESSTAAKHWEKIHMQRLSILCKFKMVIAYALGKPELCNDHINFESL